MATLNTIGELSGEFAGSSPVRYLTGIREIDRYNVLVGPGKVILVGSRPSAGRTLFMLYLFFRIWKTEGIAQCFVTNEESAQECYSRLAAMATGIERLKLREELDLSDPVLPGILNSGRDFIMERRFPWEVIREELILLATEKGVRVFYLDKIQALYSSAKFQNRDQETNYLVREIRNFAAEYGVAFILSSTLNRRVDSREGKVPHLGDLRDSGAMEDHCDAVLLIHRPVLYGITDDEFGNDIRDVAEVYLAKNRYGPTGTLCFQYNSYVPRFEEYVPKPQFDFNARFEKSSGSQSSPDNLIAPF